MNYKWQRYQIGTASSTIVLMSWCFLLFETERMTTKRATRTKRYSILCMGLILLILIILSPLDYLDHNRGDLQPQK